MCESQRDPEVPNEQEGSQEEVVVRVNNGGQTPIEGAFGHLDLQDEDIEQVPRVSFGQGGPQVPYSQRDVPHVEETPYATYGQGKLQEPYGQQAPPAPYEYQVPQAPYVQQPPQVPYLQQIPQALYEQHSPQAPYGATDGNYGEHGAMEDNYGRPSAMVNYEGQGAMVAIRGNYVGDGNMENNYQPQTSEGWNTHGYGKSCVKKVFDYGNKKFW